jgi:hypothetical protein
MVRILVNSGVFISIILLLMGCQNESVILKESLGRLIIKPEPFELNEFREELWKVGKNREQIISKGIYLLLDIPQFDTDDLERVYFEKSADSWILQVKKSGQVLQTFYFKFAAKGHRGKMVFSQNRQVALKILYPASYLSTEYDNLSCPIMNHNKKISRLERFRVPVAGKSLVLGSFNQKKINRNLEKIHFSINKVNGGVSLTGNYQFELALFDSSESKIMSNFIVFPTGLRVDYESSRSLAGCKRGPRDLEEIDEKQRRLRNFKFGR